MSVKLICFDLDQTLVSTSQCHIEALNFALVKNGFAAIPKSDLHKHEALPTKSKLAILAAEGKIPAESFAAIEKDKQEKTIELYSKIGRDDKIFSMLNTLKNMGYKLACCTNGIRMTSETILERLEIYQFFDVILTNEDVERPKPDGMIYQKAMKVCGENATTTLIIEDSPRGLAAAKASGAKNILKVNGPEDLSSIFLLTKIREMSNLR